MPSQLDFDTPPVYDPIVSNRLMTDIWIAHWSTFFQTLVSYITQNGFNLPNLSQDEITDLTRNYLLDPINHPLKNGQTVYNTDVLIDGPQFWQSSSNTWRTIQFI